jgi:hypothetical protein
VSRRSRRRPEESRREGPRRGTDPPPEGPGDGPLSSLGVQLVLLAAVFVVAVLLAELFGAANLGVAFGVGQIAFAAAVVYLILRR